MPNNLRNPLELVKGILRKRKSKKISVITITNPTLSKIIGYLLETQNTNGSWGDDCRATSIILLALDTFSHFSKENKEEIKFEIKRGIRFLKECLIKVAEKLTDEEEIYAGIEKTIISFCKSFLILYRMKSQISDVQICTILERIIDAIEKWHLALKNVHVDCTLLNLIITTDIFAFCGIDESKRVRLSNIFKKIVAFLIDKYLSTDILYWEFFMILNCLLELKKSKYKEIFYDIWNGSSKKRFDRYYKVTFEETIDSLFKQTVEHFIEKEEDKDFLAYACLLLSLEKIDNHFSESIMHKVIQQIVDKMEAIPSLENFSFYTLGLLAYAFMKSPFAKLVTFPHIDSKKVKKAIESYINWEKQQLYLLSKNLKYVVISYVLVSVSMIIYLSYLLGLLDFKDIFVDVLLIFIILSAVLYILRELNQSKIMRDSKHNIV